MKQLRLHKDKYSMYKVSEVHPPKSDTWQCFVMFVHKKDTATLAWVRDHQLIKLEKHSNKFLQYSKADKKWRAPPSTQKTWVNFFLPGNTPLNSWDAVEKAY